MPGLIAQPVPDLETVVGVEQLVQRHPDHAGRLLRVDHADGARGLPVGDHGGHVEAGRRDEQFGEHSERPDSGRIQAGLLLRFAQGGVDGAVVLGIGGASGKGHLSAVLPQRRGALGEQDVGVGGKSAAGDRIGLRRPAEQHQHRGLPHPRVARRRGGSGSG